MLIMARRPAFSLALLTALELCAVRNVAAAATDAQPVALRVTYVAPANCPSAAEFERAVLARVTVPVSFTADAPTKFFDVQLKTDAHGVVAVLMVRDGAHPESARQFRTETCEQALQALAVVAALAVDPNAAISERSAADAASSPEVAPPAVAPAAPPAPPAKVEPPRQPLPRAARPTTRASTASQPPQPAVSSKRAIYADAQVRFGSSWGPAPVALLNAGLGVAVEGPRVALTSPRFALAADAASTRLGPSATEGSFTWLVARARVCPQRFAFASSIALDACLAFDGGLLRASGDPGSAHPLERNRPWLSVGVEPELRYRRAGFFAAIALGGLFPLTRDRFLFDSGHVVHAVPPVTLSLSANAGHAF